MDFASSSAGGEILVATSTEGRHPPSSIIDGDERTFWMSTGLFPQELVLALPQQTQVHRVLAHMRKGVFIRSFWAQNHQNDG